MPYYIYPNVVLDSHRQELADAHRKNRTLYGCFSSLLPLVKGLHTILVTDRDGVLILKVERPDRSYPEIYTSGKYQASVAMALEHACKLRLGSSKFILARYCHFQMLSLNKLPVVVSMVADSSANTGMMFDLDKDFDPIVKEIKGLLHLDSKSESGYDKD